MDYYYLVHHGIKGMKWGVRRFQNPDGTLTEAGKKRYKIDSDGNIRKLSKEEKASMRQEARRVSEFERSYSKNWINGYNKAADRFNQKIDDINDKYSDYDWRGIDPGGDNSNIPKETRKAWNRYVGEVDDLWTSTYSDTLLEMFGEHPTRGKEWVDSAQFMDSYVDLVIDEDD